MDLVTETLSWHHRRHHRPDGFQNPEDERGRPLSIWKGLQWSARRFFHSKRHVPPPSQTPDAQVIGARPPRLRVTWIGHTTVLVQTPHFTLLTDPMFSRRASPVQFAGPSRLIPPALPVDGLPEIDAVLLSHDHYDHCDRASLEALHRRYEPTFLVPLGVGAHLRRWGVGPVVELDWWQRATLAEDASGGERRLQLTCTPARHFSGRSLFDRNATLWASWMIEAPPAAPEEGPVRVYFGGDTGGGAHFAEIGRRLPAPDVALLPIGAFQPRALMGPIHIGPEEAVDAFEKLGAAYAVPTHWGTFDLAEETIQAPAEQLQAIAAQRGLSDRFGIPAPGEVLSFGAPARESSAVQEESTFEPAP